MRRATVYCIASLLLVMAAAVAGSVAKKGGVKSGAPMPTLTGAEIMGHGFDAKAGRGGLMPVLSWTYQFGNTWTSPISGITYQVPDQLNPASMPQSATEIVETMSTSFSTMFSLYESWFTFSAGISYPGVFSLAATYDSELAKVNLMVSNKAHILGFSQYWSTYYTLDMAPAYVLNADPVFKLSIEKLPTDLNTPANVNLYQEFVQSFGTHYVCYGAFGGSIHLDQYVDSSLSEKFSYEQIAHQFALGFHFYLFNISAGSFHNKQDIHFAQWFAENAKTFSYWAGGTPAYQSTATVTQWLSTVADNAALLNTTLCPLSDLVSWDSTRQSVLASFVSQYLS